MIGVLFIAVALGGSDVTAEVDLLEKQVTAGDWAAAARTARAVERLAATRAPLEIVDVQTLSSPPEGLGMYTALFGGKVQSGELVVYAQVRNHALRERAGFYEIHLVSDLAVLDASGAVLAEDVGFGESRFNSRAQHRDTFVVIAMGTKGLPRGKYRLRIVLHDRIGKKSTQAEVPFEIP